MRENRAWLRGLIALLVAAALALAGCGPTGARNAQPPIPSVAGAMSTTSKAKLSPKHSRASRTRPAHAAQLQPLQDSAVPGWHVWSRTDAGPVLETVLKGPKSGVAGQVWVWLPPQYYQPAYAHTAFPVLVLHTGNTGVGENFWDNPHLLPTQRLDVKMAKARRAYPFIMVMPVLQISTRQDTECSDIPGEPAMGTWEGVDLINRIKADFRTLPAPAGWGIAGGSSGAFCAVKLALQHPRDYRAVVSWCGYFVPEPQAGRRWTAAEMAANSPTRMMMRRHPDQRMLLLAGDSPTFISDQKRMRAFARLGAPPTQITTYLQRHGGHYIADLRKLLPMIFRFLTANMQGPTQT